MLKNTLNVCESPWKLGLATARLVLPILVAASVWKTFAVVCLPSAVQGRSGTKKRKISCRNDRFFDGCRRCVDLEKNLCETINDNFTNMQLICENKKSGGGGAFCHMPNSCC